MIEPDTNDVDMAESSDSDAEPERASPVRTQENTGPPVDANKPVAINSVVGTPWCVVWTGDARSFFYNAVNKESHWVMPEELKDNEQVEKLLSTPPESKGTISEVGVVYPSV